MSVMVLRKLNRRLFIEWAAIGSVASAIDRTSVSAAVGGRSVPAVEPVARASALAPVGLAMIGLSHDHARYAIPGLLKCREVRLLGIVESNHELVASYSNEFGFDRTHFFPTIDALHAAHPVQAVAAFTTTKDHRRVVDSCASLGIHVMMEKPLAISIEDASAMAVAAEKAGIQVLVNYDTTWYPSTQAVMAFLSSRQDVGEIHKIQFRTGHDGPAHGSSALFLEWLTDPALNGGGVLMDFGCYGAALATCLMRGQRPSSVVALTQSFQPSLYPKVEDDATLVLTYPRTTVIIEASWNWPHARKDVHIYGIDGELRAADPTTLLYRESDRAFGRRGGLVSREVAVPVPKPSNDNLDQFSYLAAIVRGHVKPSGPSLLETNMIATEILDAARESARTGRRIDMAVHSDRGGEHG